MTSSFERQNLFIDAFGRPPETLPTAVTGARWRYNLEKVKKLSFAEKLKLQEFHDRGTPFYELPGWVIDGGFIQISKAEQKKQDHAYLKKKTAIPTIIGKRSHPEHT